MDNNVILLIAMSGVIGCIVGITLNNLRSKNALKANRISMEEFKEFNLNDIELIFCGDFGSYQSLNSDEIKFIELVDAKDLAKIDDMDDLPFDPTKKLVIFSENNIFGFELHKLLTRRGLKYSYIGKFKHVEAEVRKLYYIEFKKKD